MDEPPGVTSVVPDDDEPGVSPASQPAARADRSVAASSAGRPGSLVPLPGSTLEDGLASLLAAIRAVDLDDVDDLDIEACDDVDLTADEFAAQDLAMAAESGDLRTRASVLVAALETGRSIDRERIDAVLAGFRSYEPFLGERDRALNAESARALIAAIPSPTPHVRPAA